MVLSVDLCLIVAVYEAGEEKDALAELTLEGTIG